MLKKPSERDHIFLGRFTRRVTGGSMPDRLRVSLLRTLSNVAVLTAAVGFNSILRTCFHGSPTAAFEAYRIFNRGYPEAAKEFHRDMIARALEFGYLQWPRFIQPYVQGKDVLDVGCGTGVHGIGFIVAGVKSYTGIDPSIKLDEDRAKDIRTGGRKSFGWTPRQIMTQFRRIKLVPGTFEEFQSDQTFDIAVLSNVTEHLLNIEEVFRSIAIRLRNDGIILFHHHNFYCWNGHHQQPKTVDAIDANDSEQKKYLDWAHIRFEAPEGHYFRRGLNKIRLEELKELTKRYYDLEVWQEIPSDKRNGGMRLTEEISASFPELSRRDLEIHNVFCIAKRKKEEALGMYRPESSVSDHIPA